MSAISTDMPFVKANTINCQGTNLCIFVLDYTTNTCILNSKLSMYIQYIQWLERIKQTFLTLLASPLLCQDTMDWSRRRAICLAKATLSLWRNSARALARAGKA